MSRPSLLAFFFTLRWGRCIRIQTLSRANITLPPRTYLERSPPSSPKRADYLFQVGYPPVCFGLSFALHVVGAVANLDIKTTGAFFLNSALESQLNGTFQLYLVLVVEDLTITLKYEISLLFRVPLIALF